LIKNTAGIEQLKQKDKKHPNYLTKNIKRGIIRYKDRKGAIEK
jgi:hypothetical protein